MSTGLAFVLIIAIICACIVSCTYINCISCKNDYMHDMKRMSAWIAEQTANNILEGRKRC